MPRQRPLEFFFSWVGTRWAVRALAIHCPAAAKGGGGCGLTRETWNEIGRHIAGTSCLRTMLAAADYGPSPTFAQGFGGQAHAVDSLLSLAANKLLFLMSDKVC
jgi:hypothetical protein